MRMSRSLTCIQMRSGFFGLFENEGFMELPCAVRGLGAERPLLVNEPARVAQTTVAETRVMPGHRPRGRSAGVAIRRRPPVGILSELHVVFLLYQRQHFLLHELRVKPGHRVVLQSRWLP